MTIRESQVAARISKLVADLSGSRPGKVRRQSTRHPMFDFLLQVGPFDFVVDMRPSGATEAIAAAIERRELFKKSSRNADKFIPIVAVPYMGEVGKLLCEKASIGWIDLSGNAHLSAPGMLVHIEGRPNLFKQTGRPSDVFAPKSSRITRYLLIHWYSGFSIRGLAEVTGMDPGFTSRIVTRLESQGFISRHHETIHVRDPGLLLDAWRAKYEFFKHHVIRGHVAVRTGEELVRELAKKLADAGVDYAATGLSAAWLRAHFAGFRLATFYLGGVPGEDFLRDLGFREDPSGANVWLVIPNDDGVFEGSGPVEDIQSVHPIQLYMDLKDHPERSAEAAEQLRSRLFSVSNDA